MFLVRGVRVKELVIYHHECNSNKEWQNRASHKWIIVPLVIIIARNSPNSDGSDVFHQEHSIVDYIAVSRIPLAFTG